MSQEWDDIRNSDILIRFLASETTEEENVKVQLWLDESNENLDYFQQVRDAWQNNNSYKDKKQFDASVSWNKFKDIALHEEPKVKNLAGKRIIQIAGVAAIALLSTWLFNPSASEDDNPIHFHSLNQTQTITLPDNSTVILNKHSSINYNHTFGKDNRNILLDGEAFFEVQSQKGYPFTVETRDVTVEVKGTAFNVSTNANSDSTEIVVKEGIVLAYKNNKKIDTSELVLLQSDDKAIYNHATKRFNKSQNTNPNYLAWKTREFTYRSVPMHKVIDDLEDVYEVDFVVQDESFENCRLMATFKQMNIDEIIEVLELTFQVDITKDKQSITINGKGC